MTAIRNWFARVLRAMFYPPPQLLVGELKRFEPPAYEYRFEWYWTYGGTDEGQKNLAKEAREKLTKLLTEGWEPVRETAPAVTGGYATMLLALVTLRRVKPKPAE